MRDARGVGVHRTRGEGCAGSQAGVTAAVLCALLILVAAVLTGCGRSPGPDDGGGSSSSSNNGSGGARETAPAPGPARAPGHGTVFLGIDECSSFGRTSFTEVPCTGGRAAARVVARYDGRAGDGPSCPATTDFVLHISERRPAADEDGDGTVPRGYACMRNLAAPHPGDPGGGGGPRTIVGDCVYGTGAGEVRETPCDEGGGTGGKAPEYKVTAAVGNRSACPASTELYVRLGGPEPVGCARPW